MLDFTQCDSPMAAHILQVLATQFISVALYISDAGLTRQC
jgi:hypothetical protein